MGTWTPAQRRNFKKTMRAKKEKAVIAAPKGSIAHYVARKERDELQVIAEIVKLHGQLSQAGINYLKSRL